MKRKNKNGFYWFGVNDIAKKRFLKDSRTSELFFYAIFKTIEKTYL